MSNYSDEKPKICPECKKPFTEGRSDKIFCTLKCKSRFHNRENKQKNETIYKRERELRTNEKGLMQLYESGKYHKTGVEKIILDHCDIRPDLYTEVVKKSDGKGRILWCHAYGLEASLSNRNIFILHKRTNFS